MAVLAVYSVSDEILNIVDAYNSKKCKTCDDILVLDANWTESLSRNYSYICLPCKRINDSIQRRSRDVPIRPKPNLEEIKKHKRKYSLKYWQDNPDKRAYHTYKNNAKTRDLVFNITFEEFMSFWQQPCSYCGDEIKTIGVDRINSSTGYDLDNLVPCCSRCNWMKSDLSTDAFIEHCKKIIRGS